MNPIRFAMIGSQKSGTSTCLTAFRSHPQVFMDDAMIFTDGNVHRNPQHFRDDLLAKAYGKPIVGPMHPDLAFCGSGARIRACFGPDLKLLMIVRDPVRRAISNYWMEIGRDYFEKRPISVALRDVDHNFVKRGHYHRYLVAFLEHFARDQLLIVRLEDLAQDPSGVLNQMLGWIGADPFPAGAHHKHERIGHYGAQTPDDVTAFLAEHYAVSNRELHDDFGVQIDDWTSSS